MASIQQHTVVHKPFLRIKNKLFPIAVMSTAALTLIAKQASAKSWQDIVMDKHGILTSPHLIHNMTHDLDKWVQIGNYIYGSIQWIMDLPTNLPGYTVQLLSGIFHLLSNIILETPLFIFENPIIQDKMLIFSGVSIILVTVLTAINGIKQMLRKRYTPIKEIVPKFFWATAISGFSPFLFKESFSLLNALSKGLNNLTTNMSNMDFISHSATSFLDGTMLLGFDLVSIALLIPILLKTGKRWFDLLCLSAITPLAMSAYVFKETREYFDQWLKNIIVNGQTQLVYAFFLFIMSVLIFGTVGIGVHSIFDIIIRLLIMVGGLFTLANPPRIVTNLTNNGQSVIDFGKDIGKSAKNVFDTLTFNKLAMARSLYKKFHK